MSLVATYLLCWTHAASLRLHSLFAAFCWFIAVFKCAKRQKCRVCREVRSAYIRTTRQASVELSTFRMIEVVSYL